MIRSWLLGVIDEKYVSKIIKYSDDSMFWVRLLGKIPPNTSFDDPVCKDNIKKAVKLFEMGSMIIGHTPQSFLSSNDINSTCDGKIWRVDNGSSSAFNDFDEEYNSMTNQKTNARRTQYLLILNDNEYYVCDKNTKKRIKN